MNLTSTTLITGAGAATGSLIASNVGDETKRVKRRNSFIGTSLALTATYAIGEFTSCKNNAEYKRCEEALKKKQAKKIENNIERYGAAAAVIDKAVEESDRIPSLSEIIAQAKTPEELRQLKELIIETLQANKQRDEQNSKIRGNK